MRGGKLRERITVQQDTPTQNAYGEPIESWATYATRWAAVEPASGNERWTGDERLAEVTHRFRVRYDATTKNITPKMRISYDSRTFDIHSVINVGTRDREIHIMAVEKV